MARPTRSRLTTARTYKARSRTRNDRAGQPALTPALVRRLSPPSPTTKEDQLASLPAAPRT